MEHLQEDPLFHHVALAFDAFNACGLIKLDNRGWGGTIYGGHYGTPAARSNNSSRYRTVRFLQFSRVEIIGHPGEERTMLGKLMRRPDKVVLPFT